MALVAGGCGQGAPTPPQLRVGAFALRVPPRTHEHHHGFYDELTSDTHPGLKSAVGPYYGIHSPAAAALPRLAGDWLTGSADAASYEPLDEVRSLDVGASGASVAAMHYVQRAAGQIYQGFLVLLVDDSGDALMMDTYVSGAPRAWDELDRYALSLVPAVRPRSSRTAS